MSELVKAPLPGIGMSARLLVDRHDLLAVLCGRGVSRRTVRAFAGVHSMFDLLDLVARGLPKDSLTAVVTAATRNSIEALQARRRVLSDAAWRRRRIRLSPAESDCTMRVARLVALTRHVWHGDAVGAADFLSTAHSQLEGRSPLECSVSDLGAALVEDLLLRILYDFCA